MKKYVCVCIGLFLFYSSAFAKPFEYQKGDVVLSAGAVFALLGLGTDWGEFNVDDQTQNIYHDAKPGDPGIGGELKALYFIHPRVAAGISFTEQRFHWDKASGVERDVATRQHNYMAVSHIYLNPQGEYKWYIPLAIGAANTRVGVNYEPKEFFHYTGFAYHFGIGVERLLCDRWGWGFEMRYNGNRFHSSKTTDHGNRVVIYPRLNFFSGVLHIDYRL